MKIALQQMCSTLGEVEANLERIDRSAAAARAQGASLLVVPELALSGYGAAEVLGTLGESPQGRQAMALQSLAERHALTLVCGFTERDGERLFNSALVVDADGTRLCYRKCHLWGDYEREHFTAAPLSAALFDHQGLRAGVLICYDVEFPERVRQLALAGADLILVPTATPAVATSTFIATHVLPVRAFESQVFIAYANHHGHDGRFGYAGQSCIVGPDGQTLAAAAADGDALLVADIDPQQLQAARRENPYLADLLRADPPDA